jgi:predicted DNA binding CopG/RHH family protein
MKKKQIKLDADEKVLLNSFEKGEWKSVKNLKHEKEIAKRAARNTLRKNARVNIRLSNRVGGASRLRPLTPPYMRCRIRRFQLNI